MKFPMIVRDLQGHEHPTEIDVPDNIFEGIDEDDQEGRARAMATWMESNIEATIGRIRTMLEAMREQAETDAPQVAPMHLMPECTTLQ